MYPVGLCLGLTCSVLLRTIMNVAIVEIVSPMEKHQNGSSKVTLTLHTNFSFHGVAISLPESEMDC